MMPYSAPPSRHVFVYGTLRAGGSNDIARFAPTPERIGHGDIAGTLYDLGAYPGILLGGPGRVYGEIYRIAPEVEIALDALEGVMHDDTGEYIKREIVVDASFGPCACLVYEIQRDRVKSASVIASGDWIATL